jgi:hypothetical protein
MTISGIGKWTWSLGDSSNLHPAKADDAHGSQSGGINATGATDNRA